MTKPKEKWQKQFDNVWFSEGGFIREDMPELYEDVKQFIKKLMEEERENIYRRIDLLMDKKRAKELADNLEMLYGKRGCLICGTEPEKQRKMILEELKSKK